MHSLHLTYDFLYVHNASDYSRKSFWEWVKEAIFATKVGLSVYVDEMKQSPFHPSSSCGVCVLKWQRVGFGDYDELREVGEHPLIIHLTVYV